MDNRLVFGNIPSAIEGYDMVFVLPPIKTVDLKPVRHAVATPANLKGCWPSWTCTNQWTTTLNCQP